MESLGYTIVNQPSLDNALALIILLLVFFGTVLIFKK